MQARRNNKTKFVGFYCFFLLILAFIFPYASCLAVDTKKTPNPRYLWKPGACYSYEVCNKITLECPLVTDTLLLCRSEEESAACAQAVGQEKVILDVTLSGRSGKLGTVVKRGGFFLNTEKLL